MNSKAIFIGDIVEENGRTVRENNLELQHQLPLGALVEVDCDYIPEHGLRLFIQDLGRDCDGTPIYSLSSTKDDIGIKTSQTEFENELERFLHTMARGRIIHGFGEDSLTLIRNPD